MACSSTCGHGWVSCITGKFTECNAPLPKPEICNGLDDDCDGVPDDGNTEIKPCYPRNESELTSGECRFGVERCIDGGLICKGWLGPTPEVCDGLDNNCDGKVDEGTEGALDLVLVIDYSGSMNGNIGWINYDIGVWLGKLPSMSQDGGEGDVRVAVVGIPGPYEIGLDRTVVLMKNMTSPQEVTAFLKTITSASGTSDEPSLDAIYQLTLSSNPLKINWTPGSRRSIALFTDEEPQSYLNPPLTSQQTLDAANEKSIRVYVYAIHYAWKLSGWNTTSLQSGQNMSDSLSRIISEGTCK